MYGCEHTSKLLFFFFNSQAFSLEIKGNDRALQVRTRCLQCRSAPVVFSDNMDRRRWIWFFQKNIFYRTWHEIAKKYCLMSWLVHMNHNHIEFFQRGQNQSKDTTFSYVIIFLKVCEKQIGLCLFLHVGTLQHIH